MCLVRNSLWGIRSTLSEQGLLLHARRCLYKPEKPFRTFLDNVLNGEQGPEAAPEEAVEEAAADDAEFVPQVC